MMMVVKHMRIMLIIMEEQAIAMIRIMETMNKSMAQGMGHLE